MELFTCTPRAPETGAGAGGAAVRARGRTRVVDIHCHLSVPEADALVAAQRPQGGFADSFSSALTREVNRTQFQGIAAKLASLEARLADMDRMGVDVQAVSPSPGQYHYWAPPELGRELARLVNDRIAEAVGRHPGRFVGLGTVPLQAPALAVEELRRAVRELGLRGIEISSNVEGRELADPEFRPFFAAAEELGTLIFLHPLGFTHGERLSEHYFNNVIGNPLESTIAIGHLIFGGVLERHPGLKICVAHGGGYLPTYIGRMDHVFAARADGRQNITKPPSHWLRKLYFDTVMFDSDQLRWVVEKYGADHVLLGTDFPFDMAEEDPVGFVSTLPDEVRERVLGGNAAALLGLGAAAASGR
ncbi:MAG TPA: amidohydrolase family protein [Hyphomicrobiales bacterium]|nr:amidohydrolase family protein [Hyphomicrobiales bacterium]